MNEAVRQSKKITIAIVFFLILSGIGFGIYWGTREPLPPPIPNPTIDLLPLQIFFTKLFNIENNDYDFLAKIKNPNIEHGSSLANYEIYFFDSAGSLIFKKTGNFYILPGQTKYIIDGPIRLAEPASRAELKILSVEWEKLNQLGLQGVPLLVRGASYVQTLQPGVFGKVGGDIFNSSDFDLNKVDIAVVLFDQSDQPIAVNRTEIRTFLARTTRGFETTWFKPFVGQVNRVQAEAYTNVFENLNFLREYGGQEKFKQLY